MSTPHSKGYKLSHLDPQLIIAEDFEMNKLLLIALFGLVLAIGLALSFDDDEKNEARGDLER